jgi:alpha-glucosidase
LFANASQFGAPPVRALWYEFPDEPELFAIDRQYLIGRDVLVTPVLTPNVSTVDGKLLLIPVMPMSNMYTSGIFPGQGRTIWRDWYTHDIVNVTVSGNTTLAAPLGHIPVHVRDGSAILLHATPAYTIAETRAGPYALLISQAADGYAFGTAYVDDGESVPPTPHRNLQFHATTGELKIASDGTFSIEQKLETVTILGTARPNGISVGGKAANSWQYLEEQQKLVITGLAVDLNDVTTISWR